MQRIHNKASVLSYRIRGFSLGTGVSATDRIVLEALLDEALLVHSELLFGADVPNEGYI